MQARGLMYRFFGRFMRSINHTWQLYFVGLVFGIGFDTTTEVVLLAATAYAAIQGLPFFAVLALPFLFSGGMMLFDTLDGCFMNFAYGWAFARPVRKVYYNLVITGLSIGAAFIIGTIEILGVLTTEFHLQRRVLGHHGQLQHQRRRVLHRRAVRPGLGRGAHLLARRQGRGPLVGHRPRRIVPGRRPGARVMTSVGPAAGHDRCYGDHDHGEHEHGDRSEHRDSEAGRGHHHP